MYSDRQAQVDLLLDLVKVKEAWQIKQQEEEREIQRKFWWQIIIWMTIMAVGLYIINSQMNGNWFQWFLDEWING